MTTRPNNFQERLDLFLQEKRAEPFAWGVNDCCLFACDWVAILTGRDLASDLRGYPSALAAWRLVKKLGGVEQIASDRCALNGWPEVRITMATQGDVVSCDTRHGPALGVCFGHICAFPGPRGIVFRKLLECRKAWRIL